MRNVRLPSYVKEGFSDLLIKQVPAREVLRGRACHSQSGLSLLPVDLDPDLSGLPPIELCHTREFEARALEDASGVEGKEHMRSRRAARETGDGGQVETVIGGARVSLCAKVQSKGRTHWS